MGGGGSHRCRFPQSVDEAVYRGAGLKLKGAVVRESENDPGDLSSGFSSASKGSHAAGLTGGGAYTQSTATL